ncbi:TAXI family TRAP transporter solute-binding subunit [Lignipirellula cremea]|uniref:Uncharacterized protein n=1 Tax=Lignipirellula cremea TaxID=2528010 RepID=A0A518DXX4_9BACT|nr:hypothetical protein [Lignipirellula cremea]QDU96696.1 hypothetical protein Pla8534_45170 [Lignipirellula cremea]
MKEKSERLRLKSQGIIQAAEAITARVRDELPAHGGLQAAANRVVATAKEAETVSRALRRPLSLHRFPAVFLATALCLLLGWLYWRFFLVSTLTLAIPERDASELRQLVSSAKRLKFRLVATPGSSESCDKVAAGSVDLAFVQGGIHIPRDLPRLETPSPELVLWMTREGKPQEQIRRVLTSLPHEGSHSVAQRFFADWGMSDQVEYVHLWRDLADDTDFAITDDLDAVFVVKDPATEKTLATLQRLADAGFRLQSPWLGVRVQNHPYLRPASIPAGFLSRDRSFPPEAVESYNVATFLVAREGLTPRLLHIAAHVFDGKPVSIAEREFAPSAANASEIFQGIEAFLGILVYIGIAFLGLLGLEMFTYRKRFHELNSLVSLLSMLQSNKDLIGVRNPATRGENLLYLSLCSDLLGLVSATSGYYAQENASLVFNNLSEMIHLRCDNLKINIQLKILHALIDLRKEAPLLGKGPDAASVSYEQLAGEFLVVEDLDRSPAAMEPEYQPEEPNIGQEKTSSTGSADSPGGENLPPD